MQRYRLTPAAIRILAAHDSRRTLQQLQQQITRESARQHRIGLVAS
ncbi:MAG: hypothetical protein WC683_09340 [bacterium]|jgi:hypothetical protein